MKTIADLTKFLDKVEKELARFRAHVVKAFAKYTLLGVEPTGKDDAIAAIDRCYQMCREHYDTVITNMNRMKEEWEHLAAHQTSLKKTRNKKSSSDLVAIQIDRFVTPWLQGLEQLYEMNRGYLYQCVDRILVENLPPIESGELEFTQRSARGYCAVYESRTLPKAGRNVLGQIHTARTDIKISPQNIAKSGSSFFLPYGFTHSEFEKPFYYHGEFETVKAEVIANATQIVLAAITSNEGYRDFNSYSKIIQKGIINAANDLGQ